MLHKKYHTACPQVHNVEWEKSIISVSRLLAPVACETKKNGILATQNIEVVLHYWISNSGKYNYKY